MLPAVLLLVLATTVAAENFPYVYAASRDKTNVSMRGLDLDRALRLLDTLERPFFWFQRGGKTWVIRDHAVLADIEKVMAPMRNDDPELERLERKMRPLEQREERLDDAIDRLSDAPGELTPAQEARMRELEREMRIVEEQLRILEKQERALEEKQEKIEAEAEQKLVPIVDRAMKSGRAIRR